MKTSKSKLNRKSWKSKLNKNRESRENAEIRKSSKLKLNQKSSNAENHEKAKIEIPNKSKIMKIVKTWKS